MQKSDAALRKRQQIAKANRTMFLWVAAISAVVGIAVVLSIFLFQRLVFNEKILAKKQSTVSTLVANNKATSKLEDNIRLLNTDQSLLDSKAKPDDAPLQVILDALPAEANSSALGASLQNVLLPGDGISIDSLTVDPISDGADGGGTMEFAFTVSTPAAQINSLRDLLRRLERSIRAIDVTSLTVEMQGSNVVLSVKATAFYEPAKVVELKDETVRP